MGLELSRAARISLAAAKTAEHCGPSHVLPAADADQVHAHGESFWTLSRRQQVGARPDREAGFPADCEALFERALPCLGPARGAR